MRELETDVVIVGGGLAALRGAYDARREGARVMLIVKGKAGRSGSSAMTSAGYSSAITAGDSAQVHFQDTLRGGRELNDQRLVRIMVREAPERLRELMELGGALNLGPDGEPLVKPSGDHSVSRTASAVGHTGIDFTQPLTQVTQSLGVEFLESTIALDVLVDGSTRGILGMTYADPPDLVEVRAPAVVLATGGAGRLFAVTSNPSDATGDGYAMALRAGATLRDMEFIQFYPWRCIVPFENTRMPIQPSTFVYGARLLNADGERFMARYDPERFEATTRDVAARAIYDQIHEGKGIRGGVRLDVMGLSDEDWARSNPRPNRYFVERGLSFREVEMIVAPEAHFFMGGVTVDTVGESAVPGLFAIGETAGGVHGANRIDSNAIPETQVFGARAGRAAARLRGSQDGSALPADSMWASLWSQASRDTRSESGAYAAFRRRLQDLMWNDFGIVRDGAGMEAGLDGVLELRTELERATPLSARDLLRYAEMFDSLQVAEVSLRAGLARHESRGAHYRRDFPLQDDAQGPVVIEAAEESGVVQLRPRAA